MVCEAGTYSVQSGMGPITRDPNCNGTHCELFTQPTVATLQVTVSRLCPLIRHPGTPLRVARSEVSELCHAQLW